MLQTQELKGLVNRFQVRGALEYQLHIIIGLLVDSRNSSTLRRQVLQRSSIRHKSKEPQFRVGEFIAQL
jgi:hypothetical protein